MVKIEDDKFPVEHGVVIIGAVGDSSMFMEPTDGRTDRTVAGKREMLVLDLERQEWKDKFLIIKAGAIVPDLKRP